MRQRIGTARNNWTMRERLRAAKLAARSIARSCCGLPVNFSPPREAQYDIRARKRPLKPPSATAQQQASRSAKVRRGGTQATNPLSD
jgi:hypothetical protein